MILTAGPGDPLYRFGAFTVDPVVGRLYHEDDEVALTPKSFKVLLVLVGSRGRLVDKEELFRLVWPDTFVEPNNLARNVSMIRKALHERDPDHEYIVTVSGRGYRFVSPVGELPRTALAQERTGSPLAHRERPEPPVERTSAMALPVVTAAGAGLRAPLYQYSSGMPFRQALVLLTVVAGLLSVVGALAIGARHDAGADAQRRLWQLTTTGRLDGEPTWSPDGQSIAYSSDRDGTFKIWIQRLRGGSPVAITSGPARDWQPSWSPDGQHIAFRSERDGGGLFIVPTAGGGARRIAGFGYHPQWSPDGARLLFCAGKDLYVTDLDGTRTSTVANDVISDVTGRCRVAWHPDGRHVSVSGRTEDQAFAFLTIPLAGGPPVVSKIAPAVEERLRKAALRLDGFVWARDGSALFFEGRSERTQNLWRIRVNRRTLEWIAGPDRLTTGAGLDRGLALSPEGARLAFGSRFERTSVWSLPFDASAGRITGKGHAITPEGANAKILDISPDGAQLVYRVTARDTDELWIRSLDRQADRLRKVEIDAAIVHPRWSRDGTRLAYLRRPSDPAQPAAVVLLAANGEQEHQLAPATRSLEMVYDWGSEDGTFLVRCRTDSGRSAVCRLSTSDSRGEMEVIAAHPERDLYAAAYSPDGRWVSFIAARDLTRSTVFVSPAGGGRWNALTSPEDLSFEDLPRWSPDGRTLFFLSNRNGFWNLWGRRVDPDTGMPVGEPYQISRFDSTVQMVGPEVSALQFAVTRDRLILPVTETSGAVWILENVNR